MPHVLHIYLLFMVIAVVIDPIVMKLDIPLLIMRQIIQLASSHLQHLLKVVVQLLLLPLEPFPHNRIVMMLRVIQYGLHFEHPFIFIVSSSQLPSFDQPPLLQLSALS